MSLSSVTSSQPISVSPTASTSLVSASVIALISSSISSTTNISSVSASSTSSIPTPSTLEASVKSVAETLPKYLIAGGVALAVVIIIGLAISWWKLKVRRNRHFDEEDHHGLEKRQERLGSIPSTPRRGSDQTVVETNILEKTKDIDSPDSEKTLVGALGLGNEDGKTRTSTRPASTSPKRSSLLNPRLLSAIDDEPYVLVSRSASSSPSAPASSTLPKYGTASLPLPRPTGDVAGSHLSQSGARICLERRSSNAPARRTRDVVIADREEHHVPVLPRQ